MERFCSQLYEKHINLKKRKFTEIEESNKKRISDTLQYQSAIEQLIEDLKNENDLLHVKIVSMQEQYQESQKLLFQERQKTKALSNEVEALKETLAQKNDNLESASLGSPCRKSIIRIEDSNECLPMKNSIDIPSGQNQVQSENTAIILREIDNDKILVHRDEPMNVFLLPDCCRITKTNYGTGIDRSCSPCIFHSLVELLIGMKVSVECQTEGLRFSIIHQLSGYNFTLSWMKDNDGGEEMFFYRVSSLGTIENIALEWMKDDMETRILGIISNRMNDSTESEMYTRKKMSRFT